MMPGLKNTSGAMNLPLRRGCPTDYLSERHVSRTANNAPLGPRRPVYSVFRECRIMSANRLAALAHYVIWRCNPAELGTVKLNKILWFADLEYYRRTGHTITGATAYTKLPHGPVAKGILEALDGLEAEDKIA